MNGLPCDMSRSNRMKTITPVWMHPKTGQSQDKISDVLQTIGTSFERRWLISFGDCNLQASFWTHGQKVFCIYCKENYSNTYIFDHSGKNDQNPNLSWSKLEPKSTSSQDYTPRILKLRGARLLPCKWTFDRIITSRHFQGISSGPLY